MSTIEDDFATKIIELKNEITKVQIKYDKLLKQPIEIKKGHI